MNSRPSQASHGPNTRPSITATRPPRMNGRPAGWGGASTWPMSSTKDMRARFMEASPWWSKTGAQPGSIRHAVRRAVQARAIHGRLRGTPVARRTGEGAGLPVPLATTAWCGRGWIRRMSTTGSADAAGHPGAGAQHRQHARRDAAAAQFCAGALADAGRCRRHGAWPSWQTIACRWRQALPIGLPITAAALITEITGSRWTSRRIWNCWTRSG